MANTDSTRVAKRKTVAKKVTGSFRVKNPNNNVVINVRKEKVYDMGVPSDSLFINMDDNDIIVRNILCFGEDVVFGENIKVWEVEMIVAMCKDIHEIDVNVEYTRCNEWSAFVRFSAKLSD